MYGVAVGIGVGLFDNKTIPEKPATLVEEVALCVTAEVEESG
jgi:hypothetical protein